MHIAVSVFAYTRKGIIFKAEENIDVKNIREKIIDKLYGMMWNIKIAN